MSAERMVDSSPSSSSPAEGIVWAIWRSQTLPRLLAYLVQRPGEEFTVNELTAALPANRESLFRALARAMMIGVIVCRRTGSWRYMPHVYRSDPDSPLFAEIQSLCAKIPLVPEVRGRYIVGGDGIAYGPFPDALGLPSRDRDDG